MSCPLRPANDNVTAPPALPTGPRERRRERLERLLRDVPQMTTAATLLAEQASTAVPRRPYRQLPGSPDRESNLAEPNGNDGCATE